ncbi:MAG: hypothetical protein QW103_02265 [Candidatus Pacearchaeota archaeon]
MKIEKIKELENELLNCERLYYFGVCILKETRILKKVLINLSDISLNLVNFYSEIKDYKNENKKIKFFVENFALKNIRKEDLKVFIEIFKFHKMHEKSSLEFIRGDNLIIYYNGKYERISKEKIIKSFKIIKFLIKKLSEE